jgi:hypothetical protein
MKIPTKEQFIETIEDIAEKAVLENMRSDDIMTARVVNIIDGKPVIQFDEDSAPSLKVYKHMKHYNPVIGDRVMLIKGIIIGGWA